jgi:hypothetical protein
LLSRTKGHVVAFATAVDEALQRCMNAPAPGSVIAGFSIRKDPDGWWLSCGPLAGSSAVDHPSCADGDLG